jgi:hypothetical protein
LILSSGDVAFPIVPSIAFWFHETESPFSLDIESFAGSPAGITAFEILSDRLMISLRCKSSFLRISTLSFQSLDGLSTHFMRVVFGVEVENGLLKIKIQV